MIEPMIVVVKNVQQYGDDLTVISGVTPDGEPVDLVADVDGLRDLIEDQAEGVVSILMTGCEGCTLTTYDPPRSLSDLTGKPIRLDP